MEHLLEQVTIAQRRLAANRFCSLLPIFLTVALTVAVLALAVPKLWAVTVPSGPWIGSWLGAALGVALSATAAATWWRRQGRLAVAAEVDHRFRLQERISSALALSDEEQQTPAGRALLSDAARRAEQIDVRDAFRLCWTHRAWLPLLPALVAFVLVAFVPDRAAQQQAAAAPTPDAGSERAEETMKKLRRKLENTRRELEQKRLQDAHGLFNKLESATQKQTAPKTPLDRKQALVKLNDMAATLQQRRDQLASGEQLQERLNSLKHLSQGPAEKMARALQTGDYQKAMEEIQKMAQDLAQRQLSEEQRAALANQLEEMQQKLAGMAAEHQEAMQKLAQQIEQARQAGNLEQANQLQQQLDKLASQMPQLDRLSQMAQQMGEAAQQLQLGQPGRAAQALSELAASLEQMQQDLDEMETLEGTLDDIANAKAELCEQCAGGG